MDIYRTPLFEFPIDWHSTVNGRWNFDLREFAFGFGYERTDIQQSHVIHGFEFTVDLRNEAIEEMDSFLNSLEGRARSFWLPGPAAAFKISDGIGANSFLIREQGGETGWEAHPGGYLYFTKIGEQSQIAKIVSVVDNADGTETVTISQISTEESSSSSSDTVGISSSSSSSESGESSSSSLGDTSSHSDRTSSSSSDWIALDDRWQVQPLYLVRLAEDNERIEVCAERWQRRSFKVVEVPDEYATIEQQPTPIAQPIFLYRFTAQIPDSEIVWRFTSHPSDVTLGADNAFSSSSSDSTASDSSSSSSSKSSGSSSSSSTLASVTSSSSSQTELSSSSSSDITDSSKSSESLSSSSQSNSSSTSVSSSSSSTSANSSSSSSGPFSETWLAVPIEHDKLSRGMKLGGHCTITADYDSVEPLRLCLPLRLAGTLRVQVYKTDVDLNEPLLQFDGVVRKPTLNGRKIRVDCAEWGDALEHSIPNFYIQRNCNYRVYESSTCKLRDISFRVGVTVTAKSGRLIGIQGSGLVGVAADYFALGWIEIGTGLATERLFVLSSSAAFGDEMTLTLSAPMSAETPIFGSLVPGCDGARSTCISKFNNLVNFGGAATPRTNLTFQAIRSTNTTGGKK